MNKWTLSSFFVIILVFNLSATCSDGSWEYKLPDEIENLFKTKEKKDHKYGKAGQLLKDEKYTYTYDEVGNLIEKSSIAETWKYKWTQGGMLKKVIRPDKKHVDFAYDALGRRLTKTYKDQTTHFVWDGNVPLHEWTSGIDDAISQVNEDGEREIITPENLTTWIFEDRTFIPMAKMQGEKSYSIITDHLGTPTEAYDEEGKKVWSRQLNIYGEKRKETGFENFIPFLFQGQYLDTETELAYNRFRYYSPESGTYISQDPILLGGGVLNIYSFVHDTNNWTDVSGLASKCTSAAGQLPPLRGGSVPSIQKTLRDNGFVRTNPANPLNQTWKHADGSKVLIHAYGDQTTKVWKTANNAHIHQVEES